MDGTCKTVVRVEIKKEKTCRRGVSFKKVYGETGAKSQ